MHARFGKPMKSVQGSKIGALKKPDRQGPIPHRQSSEPG